MSKGLSFRKGLLSYCPPRPAACSKSHQISAISIGKNIRIPSFFTTFNLPMIPFQRINSYKKLPSEDALKKIPMVFDFRWPVARTCWNRRSSRWRNDKLKSPSFPPHRPDGMQAGAPKKAEFVGEVWFMVDKAWWNYSSWGIYTNLERLASVCGVYIVNGW